VSTVLKMAKLAVGLTFSWLIIMLAIETVMRRRARLRRDARYGPIESAYRRYPKTRPTVEFRTFRLHFAPNRAGR
jgi:hypothetical protein